MGDDIWKAVDHFFSSGYILQQWNTTNICLIPKTDRPEEASQFRPISLYMQCDLQNHIKSYHQQTQTNLKIHRLSLSKRICPGQAHVG